MDNLKSMFKTSVFGGFDKEEVLDYVKKNNEEIEAIKILHKKEIEKLKLEYVQTGQSKESLERERDAAASEKEALVEEYNHLQDELRILKEKYESLLSELDGMDAGEDEVVYEVAPALSNGSEDSAKYMEAITLVLEDARITAEGIIKEANEKKASLIKEGETEKNRILSEIEKDAERIREEMDKSIDRSILEKGVQIMVLKHTMENYQKSVWSLEEKLHNTNKQLESMISDIPQRIDQLWNNVRLAKSAQDELRSYILTPNEKE